MCLWFLWHPSSLWPWRTVENWLSLWGRRPLLTEKPSSWPAVTSRNNLRPSAHTPLDDHQSPDDDPEEEVDPHCRLRGSEGETTQWQTARTQRAFICTSMWMFADGHIIHMFVLNVLLNGLNSMFKITFVLLLEKNYLFDIKLKYSNTDLSSV